MADFLFLSFLPYIIHDDSKTMTKLTNYDTSISMCNNYINYVSNNSSKQLKRTLPY